ncbi:MAG: ABC transporter permease [Clostridiales bacterium]|nr:ABC transporter permease [Clostridiales bacterium]
MNLKENFKIAIFSIRSNVVRSVLTMLGIIIGVSSVISIMTIGTGGRDYIVSMIKDMGAACINIMVDVNTASQSDYITDADIQALLKSDLIEDVSPVSYGMGNMVANEKTSICIPIGCNQNILNIMKQNCKYGRFFTKEEVESEKKVAVFDASSAKMIFGYENIVGEVIEFTQGDVTLRLKVIGVTDFMSSFADADQLQSMMTSNMAVDMSMIMVPSTIVSSYTNSGDGYDNIYLNAHDENLLDQAGAAAKSILQARHNNYDRDIYKVNNMATYIDLLDTVIKVFTVFIAAVSAISLVVGGVGVMNIMLVSVLERTREIGIRKALGAKTATIMQQFLTESIIICLMGGIAGVILGIFMAWVVSVIMKIPLQISYLSIAVALLFSTAIGVFFGIYPAKKAATMPPIDALRNE